MSAKNGDKARHDRQRKARLARKARKTQMQKEMQEGSGKPKSAKA